MNITKQELKIQINHIRSSYDVKCRLTDNLEEKLKLINQCNIEIDDLKSINKLSII